MHLISMDSTDSMLLLSSPLKKFHDHQKDCGNSSFFDTSILQKQSNNINIVPKQFVWPKGNLVNAHGDFGEPLVDLGGFIGGDEVATQHAAKLIRAACLSHGFFQVTNHGVEPWLIGAAYDHMDAFFKLPIGRKLRARRVLGNTWGYSGAHADRFSTKLPWKETLSFGFEQKCSHPIVVGFFKSNVGKDFEQSGVVYQKYCEAMKKLSLAIMELLAIGLGVDRLHYRKLFEDDRSIMRCNYYPPCQEPGLAMGTGPHCDPTSLTILHQDHVGGLEIFVDNKWQTVQPRHDALVVNIGDTFMALSNGIYKSCLHRAVVNRYKERRSMVFFLCPREDKVVRPPQDLLLRDGTRVYPDFTWSDLLNFTQNFYRADDATLKNFTNWLLNSFQVPPLTS